MSLYFSFSRKIVVTPCDETWFEMEAHQESPIRKWVVRSIFAGAGFAVGGVLLRWDAFFAWARGADWSTLPAATVGATIPAVAGVMFAQAFARRSVKTFKQAEIDVQEGHEEQLRVRDSIQREARRRAWLDVHRVCEALVPEQGRPEFSSSIESRIQAEFRIARANTPKGEKFVNPGGGLAISIAADGVEWWEQVRLIGPVLVKAMAALVEDHKVEAMLVPLQTIERMLSIANDGDRDWLPRDADYLIDLARRREGASRDDLDLAEIPWIEWAARRSRSAVRDLARVADRHRTVGHAADQVDTLIMTTGMWGGQSREEDVVAIFATLGDSLQKEDTVE